MDIKDMLKSGKTPDELREMLEKEIAAAQKDEKNEKEETLRNARAQLTNALVDYAVAIDLMKEEDNTQDMRAEVYATIAEVEEELPKIKALFSLAEGFRDIFEADENTPVSFSIDEKDIKDSNDIIKTFLKGLL